MMEVQTAQKYGSWQAVGKAKFGGSGAGMVVVGLGVGVSFSCCGSHLGELCPSGGAVGPGGGGAGVT